MTQFDVPTPPGPDAYAEACEVSVEGANVVVRGPGAALFALTAEAAQRTAERLLEAAERARSPADGAPPFPPAELVSPHAA
jgi:hypothetical protein